MGEARWESGRGPLLFAWDRWWHVVSLHLGQGKPGKTWQVRRFGGTFSQLRSGLRSCSFVPGRSSLSSKQEEAVHSHAAGQVIKLCEQHLKGELCSIVFAVSNVQHRFNWHRRCVQKATRRPFR